MCRNLSSCRQEQPKEQEISYCVFRRDCFHPTLPLQIYREFYGNEKETGPHWHMDFYALYIARAGQGIHVIDDHPYGIVRGDVYLLPPGAVHVYRDYHNLHIDACYFQRQLFSNEEVVALQSVSDFLKLFITDGISNPLPSPNKESLQEAFHDHRFHLSPEQYGLIEEMIDELYTEFTNPSTEAPILIRSQFFRMLIFLGRWHSMLEAPSGEKNRVQKRKHSPSSHVTLANILQFCEDHFHEPLTVPQLATLMSLSPSRFAEVFVQEVGISPAAYLRRLRLERAQTLLRTTTLSTTAIAHQVGFKTLAQFSHAFRAMYHLAPTDYRAIFKGR